MCGEVAMMIIGGRHAASRPSIWVYSNPDWRSSDMSRDLGAPFVYAKSRLQPGAIHDGRYPQNPPAAACSFQPDLYKLFSENTNAFYSPANCSVLCCC